MGYKEARNRLMCGNTAHSCKADYIKLAIEALDKQIPQKMIEFKKTNNMLHLCYRCPSCDTEYNRFYYGKPYCIECGQAIDWKEGE